MDRFWAGLAYGCLDERPRPLATAVFHEWTAWTSSCYRATTRASCLPSACLSPPPLRARRPPHSRASCSSRVQATALAELKLPHRDGGKGRHGWRGALHEEGAEALRHVAIRQPPAPFQNVQQYDLLSKHPDGTSTYVRRQTKQHLKYASKTLEKN